MKNKEWKIPYSRPAVPRELLAAGYTPLLSAVLALRGIDSAEQAERHLCCSIESLHDPMLMQDMEKARQRIARACEAGECVAVYGDYDVDGITATCLVSDYLKSCGLQVIPYIPDRNEEGYGLNLSAVDALHAQGVSLIITVDCGITAVEEAEYCRSLGIDIIITDHHECKSGVQPCACALIDCKQPGNIYPNENLAGVGVALKLVCACSGDTEAMLRRYCDLVAIGTVADVMPLVGENRYLVIRGLEKLSSSPGPGIAAMLRHSGVDTKKLTASTVGYSLAPRLNAAGRLGQAATAAKLLMTDSEELADALAEELCRLNRERQSIETDIWKEAAELLEQEEPDGPIVLASDRWHQGVIGIAASRLAEQYSLPAIMICLSDGHGKGSCRSYGGFNIFEALSACSQHLTGFGGHALAAGLSIEAARLDDFRAALREYYLNNRPEAQPEVQCDLLISKPSMLSVEDVRSLDRLEPYGNSNPKPLMCICGASVKSLAAVGKDKQHLRLRIALSGESFECIYFSHTAKELELRENDRIDLAFSPQINEYRGHVSVQLLVSALRHHQPEPLCAQILTAGSDKLWAAIPYCPDRADFVRVWRAVDREDFCLADSLQGIIAQCPEGMEPERFCLCLAVFHQVGLLAGGRNGSIFSASAKNLQSKADLEGSELMQTLRSL